MFFIQIKQPYTATLKQRSQHDAFSTDYETAYIAAWASMITLISPPVFDSVRLQLRVNNEYNLLRSKACDWDRLICLSIKKVA